MGKQVAVKLSRKKEIEFNKFLSSKGCVFILSWSKSKKLNILNNIPPVGPYNGTIYLGNQNFSFSPRFVGVKKEYLYRTNGNKYGLDTLRVPVIEYSRGPIYRIYWDKDFGISGGEYDTGKFEKWYNEVFKWIKENCEYKNGVYVG
jgi:hypothetical protein